MADAFTKYVVGCEVIRSMRKHVDHESMYRLYVMTLPNLHKSGRQVIYWFRRFHSKHLMCSSISIKIDPVSNNSYYELEALISMSLIVLLFESLDDAINHPILL